MTDAELQRLLDDDLDGSDVRENALNVFVRLAKAQPFEDGNRPTALFVANGLLLDSGGHEVLTIPVDEDDPHLADTFNDLLARAYVRNEHEPVKDLLRAQGFTTLKG